MPRLIAFAIVVLVSVTACLADDIADQKQALERDLAAVFALASVTWTVVL
jgi:hypothetical protein